jgi:uncharacterized membrane protein
MTTRGIRWLYQELPELVRNGVLDRETAQRIERHYGPVPETTARGLLVPVFGVLGALLVGAGVMLLVGHNWDELGRPLRAGLSFALLLIAQGIAGWTFWQRRNSIAWYEGSSLFLGLAVGATIALIAQTYQISGDLKSYLLTWSVLVIPIPYLLRSRVAAGLYWICVTWWLSHRAWLEPVGLQVALFFLLLALILPFMVWLELRQRHDVRTTLLLWTAAICMVIAGFDVLPNLPYGLWLPIASGFFGALYVWGLERHDAAGVERVAAWRRPLHIVGATGLAVMLFSGSFADLWRHLDWERSTEDGYALLAAMGAIGLGLVAFSAWRGYTLWMAKQPHRTLLALTPLMLTTVWALAYQTETGGWLMLVVNIVGLAVGIATVHAGFRGGSVGTANCGLLLVVALVVARFFDDDWSFVVRGLGFIAMGIAFLMMNVWLLKRRREVRE